MTVSYNKLWKKLIDNNMTKTELKNKAKLSSATLANIGKNKYISMKTLNKICCILDCDYGDIIERVEQNKLGEDNND